jgi:hypothetical protein
MADEDLPLAAKLAWIAAATAARDINDELTIVLSVIGTVMEDYFPGEYVLEEAKAAVERCTPSPGGVFEFLRRKPGYFSGARSSSVFTRICSS